MPNVPLRLGTDRSDPGFIDRVAADCAAIERYAGAESRLHNLPNGAGLLVEGRYPEHEGMIANGPHLRIALCTGAGARVVQRTGGASLEGFWRPGTMAITPPNGSGEMACGAVSTIGLAVLPSAVSLAPLLDPDRLTSLAGRFLNDPLTAAVLTALHLEADLHGASTAFFEHGIALILQRLTEIEEQPQLHRAAYPLSRSRYDRVAAFTYSRLDEKLSVADMAAIAGMEPSGFTRSLRARTGLAPFAWLTRLRMDRAQQLLAAGYSVTHVAGRVGYANASKFAAAFHRMVGVAPSEWRARCG